jgi:hypothetical protein
MSTRSRSARPTVGRVALWLSESAIQFDQGSDEFAAFVSRAGQARYLSAGFRVADDLDGVVAGLGCCRCWTRLACAPSQRTPSPRLRLASTATRSRLRSSGLPVTVTTRIPGPFKVQLRQGAVVRTSVHITRPTTRSSTLRLQFGIGIGRHAI